MGDDLFLVDPVSGEIHHLDMTATALWTLLAEPADMDGIIAIFGAAFPDQSAARLRADLEPALSAMIDGGLVERTG